MSKFLEELKDAADNGKFNSDAAKKINEINDLANTKLGKIKNDKGVNDLEEFNKLKEKLELNSNNVAVTEEKALELNSEYEKKMTAIKKQDKINSQLAILIEIEDMVKASINDMFSFLEELEIKYEKDFEDEEPMSGDLYLKIGEIKSKYNSINQLKTNILWQKSKKHQKK